MPTSIGKITLYAVLTPDGKVETRRSKPRWVLDLRSRVKVELDELVKALDRYYVRYYKQPDTIRLNRMARARLGDPTTIYGIKVTL